MIFQFDVCLVTLRVYHIESVQKFLIGHDTEPCRSLVANVTIINNSLQDVGKDGKLQLLLCIAVRYVRIMLMLSLHVFG